MVERQDQDNFTHFQMQERCAFEIAAYVFKGISNKEAVANRRIFSLVDTITKPKFSYCPNVFKIGLFR